jgi:hypothetical protein
LVLPENGHTPRTAVILGIVYASAGLTYLAASTRAVTSSRGAPGSEQPNRADAAKT